MFEFRFDVVHCDIMAIDDLLISEMLDARNISRKLSEHLSA